MAADAAEAAAQLEVLNGDVTLLKKACAKARPSRPYPTTHTCIPHMTWPCPGPPSRHPRPCRYTFIAAPQAGIPDDRIYGRHGAWRKPNPWGVADSPPRSREGRPVTWSTLKTTSLATPSRSRTRSPHREGKAWMPAGK